MNLIIHTSYGLNSATTIDLQILAGFGFMAYQPLLVI